MSNSFEVGSLWETNDYGTLEVIDYKHAKNITVRFLGTGFITTVQGDNMKRGSVKDKLYPTVFGVGCIGDGKHNSWENGRQSPIYMKWKNMLERCYSSEWHEKQPTYTDCTVCDEWLNYQNFADWYIKNHPKDGCKYQLDKDLIAIGNKVYSPEVCIFVTSKINRFICENQRRKGKYLTGVYKESNTGKFKARYHTRPLGVFDSEMDAHMAWRNEKYNLAIKLASECKHPNVSKSLLDWAEALMRFEVFTV